MKKRFFKTAVAVILMLTLILTFASCGSTTGKLPDAESASGEIEGTDIEWSYDKDDKVLEIEGTGAIPDSETSEAVWWYAVRHSVQTVEISEDITSIGDYAFYYFASLEEIELPAGVTELGDLAFAFCSSLEAVELPDALTSIGESCFEACISLEDVFVPAGVTSIGARAFAHCSSLETALIMAQIKEIGAWTFKGCTSLDELCFHEAVQGMTVAEDAFEDCALDFDDVDFTELYSGDAKLTVNYVYENGDVAADTHTEQIKYGAQYSVLSPTIDGYEADKLTVSGVISDFDTVVTVTYKAEAVETEAETEAESDVPAEEENKGVTPGTIIAIVILVLVVAAIIVLAVFMIRSDKKQNGKGKNSKKK